MPTNSNADVSAVELDRVRESATEETFPELLHHRRQQGWNLVAVEWEKTAKRRPGTLSSTEVPYGLQVSHDLLHLEENPLEVEAMILVLDSMVADHSLSAIATALNDRGLRNRSSEPWTQHQVFDLMPRIIEAAPDIFGTDNWRELRKQRKERRLRAV